MVSVTIGIDIGTSYTKCSARTKNGTVIASSRKPSSKILVSHLTDIWSATEWWKDVKEVFNRLFISVKQERICIKSICVSAIAPTLTLFDSSNPDKAYSILYSTLPKFEDGSSFSQCDPLLTEYRLNILKQIAITEHFIKPCVTDLVGYINWRFTEALTINNISLVEMGMSQGMKDCERLTIENNISPRLVAVGEVIGIISKKVEQELNISKEVTICGGCPDTMSSIVGAGLSNSQDVMLYLGTFGSFMSIEKDVQTLLDSTNLKYTPFNWQLSVPGLGPQIEFLSHQWFDSKYNIDCLATLDQFAASMTQGADGTLFLIPRWKNGMTSVGKFEFMPNRKGEIGNIARCARAVLESISYAILAVEPYSCDRIYVSGGGSRSKTWINIISSILEKDLLVHNMAWEAVGAADIAARTIWSNFETRPLYYARTDMQPTNKIAIDNFKRVMEYYNEFNWL